MRADGVVAQAIPLLLHRGAAAHLANSLDGRRASAASSSARRDSATSRAGACARRALTILSANGASPPSSATPRPANVPGVVEKTRSVTGLPRELLANNVVRNHNVELTGDKHVRAGGFQGPRRVK